MEPLSASAQRILSALRAQYKTLLWRSCEAEHEAQEEGGRGGEQKLRGIARDGEVGARLAAQHCRESKPVMQAVLRSGMGTGLENRQAGTHVEGPSAERQGWVPGQGKLFTVRPVLTGQALQFGTQSRNVGMEDRPWVGGVDSDAVMRLWTQGEVVLLGGEPEADSEWTSSPHVQVGQCRAGDLEMCEEDERSIEDGAASSCWDKDLISQLEALSQPALKGSPATCRPHPALHVSLLSEQPCIPGLSTEVTGGSGELDWNLADRGAASSTPSPALATGLSSPARAPSRRNGWHAGIRGGFLKRSSITPALKSLTSKRAVRWVPPSSQGAHRPRKRLYQPKDTSLDACPVVLRIEDQDKLRKMLHSDGASEAKGLRCENPSKDGLIVQHEDPWAVLSSAGGGASSREKLFLTFDSRVHDACRLSKEERTQVLQEVTKLPALVLTVVYQDGTTQLDPEQKSCPSASGILILLQRQMDVAVTDPGTAAGTNLIYLRLEQQESDQDLELFTRDLVLQVLARDRQAVCYKAKDLLHSVILHCGRQLSWKQVSCCRLLDPHIAAWLLDPAEFTSSFPHLVAKHGTALGHWRQSRTLSDVVANLFLLYRLMTHLYSRLQTRGLEELFCNLELGMVPILVAMESHRIQVDRDALKRTSELLGLRLKQLEQEAHRVAGQEFLVSSSVQLRQVLFEKLRLHEHCEGRKLPRTVLRQQQSTSESVLLQLQELHPLPRIVLEFRQVHKVKSTFIDGILSCMSETSISPMWNQTSTVSGRLSARHPNFQALPRLPVQIAKKQDSEGAAVEMVTVHPRSMFLSHEGWTFLAADYCQIELRLLAHLSSDPELLRAFHDPTTDVFTMLACKWNEVPVDQVSPRSREQAKRVVYSVIYGAGRRRLASILGVSSEQAASFMDSFLQAYKEVQCFIQRTIQQCRNQGYVSSLMGRQRSLPHIQSTDDTLRNQAERQAVNFVLQGSSADLCKMAMIHIFCQLSSSPRLTARLIAQIHDELLFEVEDSQVMDFAVLVKTTMESLQHIDCLDIHLKVPLKVAMSSGKSWGVMSELLVPAATPRPAP